MHTPHLATLPTGVVTLADHEAHARTVLDANAWAYFGGGAGDEVTLRANRSGWDEISLLPRVLRPLEGSHTCISLLGQTWAHPLFVAPMAYQCMAHPDGELATAYAAAAQGAGLMLSTQSSMPLEAVADAVLSEAGRGPLWFQLYLQADWGVTLDLVRRAEQAGYEALVVTVDAPHAGVRDRERRVNFQLPAGARAVNLNGHFCPAAATWEHLARLQAATRLPILLKGILHPDDARQAARLNFAGLIVSNHGGRTLDTAIPTCQALPRIAQAVAGQMTVLVDGGIRRGTDVLKAMAMGANAVLVGRPCVFGLANAGALGVAHVLRLLRDELAIAMALCGCATLDQLSPELLFRPDHRDAVIDGR